MSDIFFTADLHLRHRKVTEYRGFGSSEEHDTFLAERWSAVVRPQDQVWVLGDLALKPEPALGFFNTWPGTKHLITGNHDACHPMHRRSHRALRQYLEVFESIELHSRFKTHGIELLLSHFPYYRDHTDPPRYLGWRLPCIRGNPPLLHGHTHGAEHASLTEGQEFEIHVGVDAWDLTPVSLEDIADLIALTSEIL